jgi:hypothetical protein
MAQVMKMTPSLMSPPGEELHLDQGEPSFPVSSEGQGENAVFKGASAARGGSRPARPSLSQGVIDLHARVEMTAREGDIGLFDRGTFELTRERSRREWISGEDHDAARAAVEPVHGVHLSFEQAGEHRKQGLLCSGKPIRVNDRPGGLIDDNKVGIIVYNVAKS